MAKKSSNQVYTCRFCDRKFKREETVNTHKCIKRDRYEDRQSRQMMEAFRIYMQFMELNKFPFKKGVEPFIAFIKSKYFNDFYNFAQYYLNNRDIINVDEFVKYLIINNKPITEWSTYKAKDEWILKTIRAEHPKEAIARSVISLVEWAENLNVQWNTFFENVSSARAIAWIESGKISPWIIWLAPKKSTNKFFKKLSNSEIEYILKYIDPSYFEIKTIKYKKDCDEIKIMLCEAGL
ncbi:hypothetical protein GNZ01_06085 [Escherichia coli]|uniref:Uncharacterized protein n=1 Tax=Escherichia coli TaxID=562 RepID=A0AAJ2Y5E4_ECOLX|nr:hypothetical protein [Escherichia coli]MUM71458.1 hypothetical protein [Escherichia coli]MUM82817.1 hypothetical protein [Escherichia coli]